MTQVPALHLLTENIPDFIFRYRFKPAPGFEYVSQSATALTGYTPAEYYADPELAFKLIHPEDRHLLAALRHSPNPDLYNSVILRWVSKDGRVFWGEQHNYFIYDDEGDLVAVEGIARDVTERVQAELALRRANRALRTLSECNQALIWADQETDLLNDICRILVKIGGYRMAWVGLAEQNEARTVRPAAQVSLDDLSLSAVGVTWDDSERGRGPTGTAIRTGRPTLIRDLLADPDSAPWRAENSRHGYVSALSLPLRVGSQVIGALTVYTAEVDAFDAEEVRLLTQLSNDMSYGIEALRVRLELKASQERFRLLMGGMKDLAIFMLDPAGQVVSWNAEAERIKGYQAAEIIGQHFSRLYLPEDIERGLPEQSLQIAEVEGRFESEGWSVRRDGSRFWANSIITTVRDGTGQLRGFVMATRDVTERKGLEMRLLQAQKLEAIGRLAGGVAHDFNNIMTAILGYTGLSLRALPQGDPLRDHIEGIQKIAARAGDLTRQLLAFARKQVIEPQQINLNKLVLNVDKMLRRLIGEDIELVTVLDSDLGWIRADPGQLEQVLLNLAVNARDAMPAGGELIIQTANVYLDSDDIRTQVELTPGPYVLLTVTDTGIGMTEEIKAHLFEPFFTTKEAGHGTGLGLATSFGIIKQSNGHIWVESEPGQGTSFKIYLPRVETDGMLSANQGEVEGPPSGSETVLLVEDEAIVRRLAAEVLRQQGYGVLEATNGEEALRLVEAQTERKIDLLLTDVVMPRLGGIALVQELKIRSPHLKVLFTSGYTDETTLPGDILKGNVAFLPKPFSPATLATKVRQVLDS